jgi:hypothetical protein
VGPRPGSGEAGRGAAREPRKDQKAVATKPKGSFPPGTPAPASGQVKVPGSKVEVTVVQDKPMPPTPKPGQEYVYVDLTKHAPKKNG